MDFSIIIDMLGFCFFVLNVYKTTKQLGWCVIIYNILDFKDKNGYNIKIYGSRLTWFSYSFLSIK